jgi:hypothetical protein
MMRLAACGETMEAREKGKRAIESEKKKSSKFDTR